MRRITYSGALDEDARSLLNSIGALYIEQVGGETELLSLAAQLGEVVSPGVAMRADMHDGKVYSVKVRDGGRGQLDEHGHVILSTTSRAFPLHTDAFNRPEPPRYVLLLRADDSDDETTSLVSDSWQALKGASSETLHLLSEPIFPSALGPVRLLELTSENRYGSLRFNQEETERWSERSDVNPSPDPRAAQVVADLGERLRAAQETFTIRPHDCLLLDNRRVCHGRGDMAPDSRRVLQRAWVE